MQETCRFCEEATAARCGKPAVVIVWGKLSDPDDLGPRCVEHVPDCIDISRIDQYAVTVVGDWARRGDPVQ